MAPPAPRGSRHKKTFSFGSHRREARAEEREEENTRGTDRGPLAGGDEDAPTLSL